MRNIKLLSIILVLLTMTISCAKDKDAEGVLEGTWTVEKVEGQYYNSGVPGLALEDNNPTGTVRFNGNGTGEQNYSFSLFGTVYPQNGTFFWSATEASIIIDLVGPDDMVWTRVLSESNKQIASYDIAIDAVSFIRYKLTMEK